MDTLREGVDSYTRIESSLKIQKNVPIAGKENASKSKYGYWTFCATITDKNCGSEYSIFSKACKTLMKSSKVNHF